VRYEVPNAVTKKYIVTWDVMPCSVVEVYRRVEGTSCHMLGRRIHVDIFTPKYPAPIPKKPYHSKLIICVVEFELLASRMRPSEVSYPDTASTT